MNHSTGSPYRHARIHSSVVADTARRTPPLPALRGRFLETARPAPASTGRGMSVVVIGSPPAG